MPARRILITGAAGFVGGHLIDGLGGDAAIVGWFKPDTAHPRDSDGVTWMPVELVDREAVVAAVAPRARTWCFGHAADGNVHVNVTGLAADDEVVAEAVLGAVAERGGSISAEHGIGRAKRRWVHLARTPAELAAMRAVKGALDPHGICNPGVLLP